MTAHGTETLIGWWTRFDDRTFLPAAQCVLVAVETVDGTVTYRRHRQSIRPSVGRVDVQADTASCGSIDDLLKEESAWNPVSRRRVRDDLEECWTELRGWYGPSFAPRPVREYWFDVA